jgi:hypothetical protein
MAEPLLFPSPGIVPGGAELAAAPDIGDDPGAAPFEPELADLRVVIG